MIQLSALPRVSAAMHWSDGTQNWSIAMLVLESMLEVMPLSFDEIVE